MEKKRLVIELEEAAHQMLATEARQHNQTLANYVRHALQLPLERQGVKPLPTQLVRPAIEDTSEFYVVKALASYQIWIPGIGDAPSQVHPTPRLSKASYASPESVRSNQLQVAQNDLRGEDPLLLLSIPHSFGLPFRAVRVFRREWRLAHPLLPNAVTYLATTSQAPYSWIEDLRQGKRGFFLAGLPNASDLWQIVSCEPDPADRCIFLLSPVKLPHGLPSPDFSKIENPTLRAEAQQHWSNLEQSVISHNSHGLVNSAASLSEALLRAFLAAPGAPSQSLSDMLQKLRNELEGKCSAFSWLGYHFMQAVRVMHQSTQHPGRIITTGRPIRPGLALMMAEGMTEVLTSLGIVEQ